MPSSFRAYLNSMGYNGFITYPSFNHTALDGCAQDRIEKLSESIDVRGTLILDSAVKTEAVNKIKKKYGAISKLFLRGPDENRAIIQLDELGGE